MYAFFNEKNVPKDPKSKDFSSSTMALSMAYIVVVGWAQYWAATIQGAAVAVLHNTHKKSALIFHYERNKPGRE